MIESGTARHRLLRPSSAELQIAGYLQIDSPFVYLSTSIGPLMGPSRGAPTDTFCISEIRKTLLFTNRISHDLTVTTPFGHLKDPLLGPLSGPEMGPGRLSQQLTLLFSFISRCCLACESGLVTQVSTSTAKSNHKTTDGLHVFCLLSCFLVYPVFLVDLVTLF